MWAGLILALAGSASARAERPPPPVRTAPGPVARLRVHVWHATDARAREEKEVEVTGYTLHVRGAVEKALVRAGYVVVVDPRLEHDVVAKIQTNYQARSLEVGDTLVTTLVLEAPGGLVEQVSGAVLVDEHADIDEAGAAALVDALSASARVARYAARLARPDVPCAPRGPAIASD